MKHFLLIPLFCFAALFTSAQNQNVSNGVVFDGEPFLAVNPTNSQHIVVAWLGWKLNNKIVIKTRTSFDAGQTWSTTTFIPHAASTYTSADPSLAFDSNGNLFLSYIDHSDTPIAGGVYLSKSIDGGLNWGTPVEVINVNADVNQYPIDRPWIGIDNSGGANDGNIYITTMSPNRVGPTAPFHPYFMRSTNGGASFQPYQYLDATNWLAGNLISQPMPTPAVGANGTFYAVYPSYLVSQSFFAQYIIASSTDGGNNFNYNTVFTTSSAANDSLAKGGYLLRTNPADVNHLAFFYIDNTYQELDIFMRESLDAGSTWSSATRVNDDPISNNRMQDLVWADFDTDGDLIVTWRDRRNAPDSTYMVSSEIYGAVRWKDSTNFSANFAITDSSISYNNVLAQNGNDFMCVNMQNDSICVVWGDTRNGFLNIWFQKIDLASGATFITDLANDIKPISLYPNPTQNLMTIDFGDNELTTASYQLINLLGEVIEQKTITTSKIRLNISNYPTGNYLLKFTNTKGSKVMRLVKK